MAGHPDFFLQLPPGKLNPDETELRQVLHRAARLADGFLPKHISLQEWVERRMPGEIILGCDAARRVILLPGTIPKRQRYEKTDLLQRQEEFFTELPVDSYTEDEERLRNSIYDFLASWQSQDLATLTQLGSDKDFKQAKNALFPAGVAIREWIERRMGAELELRKDAKGQFVVHLTGEAHSQVRDRFEVKKLLEKVAVAEVPVSEEVRRTFFASLPGNELKPQELGLRDRLLDFFASWESNRPGGPPPTLSDAGSDPGIRVAKAALLPKGLALKEWIDRRIGMEIETRVHANGQCAIFLRGPAQERNARTASGVSVGDGEDFKRAQEEQREAFLETLPADDFSEEELELRRALLAFIEQWPAHQGPPDLGKAGQHSIVQPCRLALLPKGCGCSLQAWIDRRIGGEIETSKIGTTTIFGVRGQLAVDGVDARKRKMPLDPPPMRAGLGGAVRPRR